LGLAGHTEITNDLFLDVILQTAPIGGHHFF